jgi:hypothetical protein
MRSNDRRKSAFKAAQNGGSARAFHGSPRIRGSRFLPSARSGGSGYFSLSHNPQAVSYSEIERSVSPMHSKSALVTAMRAAVWLWPIGTVSQYETSNHLCDRLIYAQPLAQ